jgi:hypothetical protein
MILKRLSMAMTFSQATRSLEMARFLSLSLADNGFFLLRFFGHARLRVPSLQALITAVGNGFRLRMQPHLRCFEQPEVVSPSFFMREAENAACRFFDDELRFQRVPLLVARIVAPLFFLAFRWVSRLRRSTQHRRSARLQQRPCGPASERLCSWPACSRTI